MRKNILHQDDDNNSHDNPDNNGVNKGKAGLTVYFIAQVSTSVQVGFYLENICAHVYKKAGWTVFGNQWLPWQQQHPSVMHSIELGVALISKHALT